MISGHFCPEKLVNPRILYQSVRRSRACRLWATRSDPLESDFHPPQAGTMRNLTLSLLVLLSLTEPSKAQDWEEAIDARRSEIQAWEPLGGVWTGDYRMEEAPESVVEQTREIGLEGQSVGIKINFLKGGTPTLEFRFAGQTEFADVGGNLTYSENALGWTIGYERMGEVWIERYVFMFNRLEERRAAMTVTRTVHNWFADPSGEVTEYFYVFNTGEVTRSRRGTRERQRD